MPFWQLLKSPYQYFKNRNGIFCELKLNLRWEQWSNILIWQLFENLPKIKYFLSYVNGQLVQRLRLFYRSKTIFVRLLPLSDEPSEWLAWMFGLKYYEGANPGKRKRELVKIDDEKKKQKSKEYETKRTSVLRQLVKRPKVADIWWRK